MTQPDQAGGGKKRHICPTCKGAMSDYMAKKEGCCWSCIKWDTKGGAYRIRFNRKNKQQLGFDISRPTQ